MENKQDILKRLASPDMTVVAAAIDEIKENGDLSIVPELLEILLHNEDTTVVTHVTSLLSDIRDTGFKTILMEKLINASPGANKANLLRVCWESAIDFSEYLEVFVNILVNEDFLAALEASTVIENLHGNMDEGKVRLAIDRLRAECLGDKAFLAEDAINHLQEGLPRRREEDEELARDHDHHGHCDGHHH